jgi:hypothetical protein
MKVTLSVEVDGVRKYGLSDELDVPEMSEEFLVLLLVQEFWIGALHKFAPSWTVRPLPGWNPETQELTW